MKWEINRISTPERIFQKIDEEMARPVGVILFGADLELKDKVLTELQTNLHDAKVFHGAPSTHEMIELIHAGRTSIFVLSSMESAEHGLRHECVKVMRKIGAKSVVGVYVKAEYPRKISADIISPDRDKMRTAGFCVNKLKNHPPTPEGLDYLLVVSEDD